MNAKALCVSLALVASLVPCAAHAQQQDNAATVEALFADGKQLMGEGKTALACPKFLASYNLEHRVGTLLNLATCYEKNDQIASAWARFVEAQTLATRANQPERATFAADHARALAPTRSMLTIAVDHPPTGLVVRRDGVVVDPAAFGVAVPVDGGAHTIEATAPDKKPLTATITLASRADLKTYTVAPLADAPHAAVAVAPLPATSPIVSSTPLPSEEPPHDASESSPRSHGLAPRALVGIGIGGLGVVAAGVGTVFGLQALSKKSDSNANGDCTGNLCDKTGFDARTKARQDGDVSSVLIGAGAAAIIGGALLWITAPKHADTHAKASPIDVGVGPTGIDVRGTF